MLKIKLLSLFVIFATLFSCPSQARIELEDIDKAVSEFQREMKEVIENDFNLFSPDHSFTRNGTTIKLSSFQPNELFAFLYQPENNKNDFLVYAPEFFFHLFCLLRIGTADDFTNDRDALEKYIRWDAIDHMSDSTLSAISAFHRSGGLNKVCDTNSRQRNLSIDEPNYINFSDGINPKIAKIIRNLSDVIYPLFSEYTQSEITSMKHTNFWFKSAIESFGKILLYTLHDSSCGAEYKNNKNNIAQKAHNVSKADIFHLGTYQAKKLTEANFVTEVGELVKMQRLAYLENYPGYAADKSFLPGQGRNWDMTANLSEMPFEQRLWLNYAHLNLLKLDPMAKKEIGFEKYLFKKEHFSKILQFYFWSENLNYIKKNQIAAPMMKIEIRDGFDRQNPEVPMINLCKRLCEGTSGYKLSELAQSKDITVRRSYFYLRMFCDVLAGKDVSHLVNNHIELFEADLKECRKMTTPVTSVTTNSSSSTASTSDTHNRLDALNHAPTAETGNMDALQQPIAPTPPPSFEMLDRRDKDKRPEATEVYKLLDEANRSYTKLAEMFGNLQFKVPNLSVEELDSLKTQIEQTKYLLMAQESTVKNIEKLVKKK